MKFRDGAKLVGVVGITCAALVYCWHVWSKPNDYADAYSLPPDAIKFRDNVDSNTALDADLLNLDFVSRDGQSRPLKEFANGKNVVLIITRGYTGSVCPYCSTQVSRMIANYDQFRTRNTEVVVVYPVAQQDDQSRMDEFVARAVSSLGQKQDVPFPILLDVHLKAVDALGIRKDLSKPATYILDRGGRLKFAYVSNTSADRPSVQALISQLDKINRPEKTNPAATGAD